MRLEGWPRPAPPVYGVDLDGSVCALQSHDCTGSMTGAGGFDQHHEWPVFLGGDERAANNTMLLLCPNHHRRQHALIRYLVECVQAGVKASYLVRRHYTKAELDAADFAVANWQAAGSPAVSSWNVPPARDA